MILQDKFIAPKSINTKGEARRFAIDCEKIADEYAIFFTEWILFNQDLEFDFEDEDDPTKVIGKLLEIYKKEKGL